MLLQIFLLLILVFHPSSGKTLKLVKCPDIFAEYQASLNIARLLNQVSRWKMTMDSIQKLDYDVSKDLEKCHEKVATLELSEEQKNLAQYLVEAMQLHLTKHVAMEKLNKSLMECAKNIESKNGRNVASMNNSIVNLTNAMEQKDGEIVKWKIATFVLIGVAGAGLILGILLIAYFLHRRFKAQMVVPHI